MNSRKYADCCFAALFMILLLPGCSSKVTVPVDPGPAAAYVNGTVITEREFEAAVDRLIPRSTYHRRVTGEKRAEFRNKALENLITAELQYQDARSRGMKPDHKLVDARMDSVRERFKSGKEYRAALARTGISEDQLRQKAEKQVLVESIIAKKVAEVAKPDESELVDYYSENTDKFRQPESMHLRIISVSEETMAKEALARLKQGQDFESVAVAMSEDAFSSKGGDIGYVHRGRIYPELEGAAALLKQGEISTPVAAEGKWYVIKLEDRKPERQMAFDEIREKLEKEIQKQRVDRMMESWISGLREKAKIEVLDKK